VEATSFWVMENEGLGNGERDEEEGDEYEDAFQVFVKMLV
jgi:hypothetical protein